MFRKVVQKKVREEVFEQIKELINSGNLKPGDKLPSERELAEAMNVSRSSIREAILKLECMGVVEQRHGEGTYVKSLTSEPMQGLFDEFIRRKETLLDLMEIRMVLETWSAARAAELATDAEIQDMVKCLNKMGRTLSSGTKAGQNLNLKFHLLIAGASRNKMLVHVMQTFSEWIIQVTLELEYEVDYSSKVRYELLDQHFQILDAIIKRDSELASARMREHINYTIQKIKERNLTKMKTLRRDVSV